MQLAGGRAVEPFDDFPGIKRDPAFGYERDGCRRFGASKSGK